MSHSRSNSKSRPAVSKETRPSVSKDAKPRPGIPSTSTVNTPSRVKPKAGVTMTSSKAVPVKPEKSKVPVPSTTTAAIKKDQLRKPVAPPRAISKERTKPNESTSKTVKPSTRSKTDYSSPAKKPSKPVPARSETATISKPQQNGATKKPLKVGTDVKPVKKSGPVKLSGSKTATKEKPTKATTSEAANASSDKEERPSTVNLSSQKGENRVIRNPDSIIANNEAVLNVKSTKAPDPEPLDQDSLDAEIDYEDDFEDYESDFEPDDDDYNDDDESESDESYQSEVSFSEVSESINAEPTFETNTSIEKNYTESSQAQPSSKTLIEDNHKPSTLSLYESKQMSDLATPMTPITVTPMTPSVPLMTPMTPSASLFNFAQAESSIIQKKSKSRASELLELITLDKQTFNIYDSPPANYEMFIQVFGSSNRKQVLVQTEGSEEQTTQTDDVDTLDKWTQNPANGARAVGGDLISEELENWKIKVNGVKFSNFITNSSCLVLKILDEETTEVVQNRLTKSDTNVPFSSGYFELNGLEITAGQSVTQVCFSEGQPTYLLSVHSKIASTTVPGPQGKSIICVWDLNNPNRPEYILAPMSVASKCCFNPGNPTIVFAGMMDGSIALWDLREQHSQHKELPLPDGMTVTFRTPTYSTAAVQWDTGHHSAIVDLQTFVYQNSSTSQGNPNGFMYENQFCNLLSLEDLGILNIWTVVGVSKSDPSGSETDLGLAPRGNLKLLKIGSVLVSSMLHSSSVQAAGLRSFSFGVEPSNPHNLFIATNAGIVLHCTRQGHPAMPRVYEAHTNKEVKCLAFNPHRLPHFVVGCNDGTVHIYNTKNSKPLLSCLYGSHCILSIQWSVIRPTVFYVLDSNSCIQIWDLAVSKTAPVYVSNFQNEGVGYFNVVLDKLGNSQWSQYIVISMLMGTIRVFKLVDNIISATVDEYDLLRNMLNDL